MKCPNCKKKNNSEAKYCINCGTKLQVVHLENKKQFENYYDNKEDVYHDVIEKIAKEIESRHVLEEFPIRLDKVMKNRLYPLTFIAAVLMTVFSLGGYTVFMKVKNTVETAINDIEKNRNEVNLLITDTKENIKLVLDTIKRRSEKIKTGHFEVEKTQELIRSEQDKIKLLKIENRQLIMDQKTELDSMKEISANMIREAEKVQGLHNALYEIFIHCPETDLITGRKECLTTLIRRLNNKGFIIYDSNIGNVSANRTEVIYYNKNAEKQAELICEILVDILELTKLKARLIEDKGRNPQEILVKINLASS